MPIDPITSFLLGSCIVACWPCLLPCCLMLPIIPFPVVIIKKPTGASTSENGDINTHNINGKCYSMYWTKKGVYLKKSKGKYT